MRLPFAGDMLAFVALARIRDKERRERALRKRAVGTRYEVSWRAIPNELAIGLAGFVTIASVIQVAPRVVTKEGIVGEGFVAGFFEDRNCLSEIS